MRGERKREKERGWERNEEAEINLDQKGAALMPPVGPEVLVCVSHGFIKARRIHYKSNIVSYDAPLQSHHACANFGTFRERGSGES
jgi:hypothetical protein